MIAMLIVEHREANHLISSNRTLMKETVLKTIANNISNRIKKHPITKDEITNSWQSLPLDFLANYQGEWIFPYRFTGTKSSAASTLWSRYTNSGITEIESDATFPAESEQRIIALRNIENALNDGREEYIKKSIEAYFLLVENYRLSALEELISGITFLQLGQNSRWNNELINLIIFEGTTTFPALTDYIFKLNKSIPQADIQQAIKSIQSISERSNIDMSWFTQSTAELWKTNPDTRIALLQDSSIIDNHWVAIRTSDELVLLFPFTFSNELKEAEYILKSQSILDKSDTLAVINSESTSGISQLADLPFKIERAQWSQQAHRQSQFFISKIVMALVFIASLFSLTAFLLVRNRKKLEFIALRENFINLVSHELKTPLASIRIMVETLQKRNDRNLSIKDYPQKVIHEVDRLWLMVDNLLSINQIKSGELKINISRVNLFALVERVIDKYTTNSSSSLSFDNQLPEEYTSFLDAFLFELIFINLFSNAIKYCKHAEVKIAIHLNENNDAILISDNACGIAPENWLRIFDDFYRESSNSDKPGTGVGLSLCRQITEIHGLSISISDSNKNGTIWKIQLPTLEQDN